MLVSLQGDKEKLEKAEGAVWFQATQLTISEELGPKRFLPPVFVIQEQKL